MSGYTAGKHGGQLEPWIQALSRLDSVQKDSHCQHVVHIPRINEALTVSRPIAKGLYASNDTCSW